MSLEIDFKKKLTNFTLEVSLSSNGDRVGILGASGCGKSMTLKCVAGIETPDEGTIIINGETVFDSSRGINVRPQLRRTGYLFQNYALFPTMTVAENIGIAIRKKNKSERSAIIRDIVQRLGLCGLEGSTPSRLSGGQQQRVALARMLVSSPAILMLDEPFSALDSFLRSQVEKELLDSIDSFKGTVLFVSHSRDEIYRICDRVAVMNDGKIESAGPKEDLFRNPRTVTAARLSGCKNIARAKKTGETTVFVPEWNIELETDRAVTDDIAWVGIRAHHIAEVGAIGDRDANNCFAFYVTRKSSSPFSVTEYLSVEIGTGTLCRETSIDAGPEDEKKTTPQRSPTEYRIPPEKILLLRD